MYKTNLGQGILMFLKENLSLCQERQILRTIYNESLLRQEENQLAVKYVCRFGGKILVSFEACVMAAFSR